MKTLALTALATLSLSATANATAPPTITLKWASCNQKISMTMKLSQKLNVVLPALAPTPTPTGTTPPGPTLSGAWIRILSNVLKIQGFSALYKPGTVDNWVSGIYTPAGDYTTWLTSKTPTVYHLQFPKAAHYTLNFGNSRCYTTAKGLNMVNAAVVSVTVKAG